MFSLRFLVVVSFISTSFLTEFFSFARSTSTISLRSEHVGSNALGNSPTALLVELTGDLVERLKGILENEDADFEIRNTVLGTFDSRGLQERGLYRDKVNLFRAIRNLRSTENEGGFCPTLHAIRDLIGDDFTGGSIVIVAQSKISDEDFAEVLAESLWARKCQISVLWAGEKETVAYVPLQELVRKTGGKFAFLSDREDEIESINQYNFEKLFRKDDANSFGEIRFPEEENSDDKESILSSRLGTEKGGGNFNFPLIVEVASGASLEIRPNAPAKIPFVVSNNFNGPLNVIFGAKLNGVPQIIQPQKVLLQPTTSVTVTVMLQGVSSAPANTTSTLAFSAFLGKKVISRSAIVSLVPRMTYDKTEPKINYKFEGDCSEYNEPKNCEKELWSLEVTAQDEESGILKILSEPYGLLFQSTFLAGTRAQVKAYYSATCCRPKVDVWAEDLKGNYIKKSFDVFNQTLLAGEIAAIVVGVILLLFIIIAIIVAIVLVKRRNRRNLIIPRARAGSR